LSYVPNSIARPEEFGNPHVRNATVRLVLKKGNGAGDGEHNDFISSSVFEHAGTGRHRRAGGEHIVNQQHTFIRDQLGMTNCKSPSETLATGFGVHAGSMHSGLRLAPEAAFVERQLAELRECLGQSLGLIKATFALPRRMEWDGHYQIGVKQR